MCFPKNQLPWKHHKHIPSTSEQPQRAPKPRITSGSNSATAGNDQRKPSCSDGHHNDILEPAESLPNPGNYVYTPLTEGCQFRLLQIRESPDQKSNSRLHCIVEVFSLDNCPPFTSVSYTWGSPFPDGDGADDEYGPNNLFNVAIETPDGQQVLAIRKNLHEALVRLVEIGHRGFLWVDAMCIDEGNRAERAMQVSLMHRIFGKCERVIIWLGKADDTVEDVAWLLEQVEQSQWMKTKDQDEAELFYEWTAKGLAGSKAWLDDVLIANTPLSDPKWLSYYKFLERTYWHRTWVVQELALAPETHVLCGDKELSWRAFTILALMLSDTEYARVLTVYGQRVVDGTRTSHSYLGHEVVQLALCRALCQADRHSGLLDRVWGMQDPMARCLSLYQEALLVTWTRAASEPRDKVYGALGIALRSLPEHIGPPIKPDYAISVVTLYIKTSWILINSLRPLLLLSYAGRRHQRFAGLPSWTMDFTGPDGSDNLMAANSKRGSLYWNASSSLPQNGTRALHGNILSLQGARLDSIVAVHDINILEVLKACLSIMPRYHTGQSPVEVIWRTLTATSSDPGAEQYRDIFKAWVKHSIQKFIIPGVVDANSTQNSCFEALDKIHAIENTSEIPRSTEIQGQSSGIDTAEKATIFQALIRGYHIFRTSNGYIGSAPQGIKLNDQVWIICDAITPLIFRPAPNTTNHVLVRESYLHGFMHGEAKISNELQNVFIQ